MQNLGAVPQLIPICHFKFIASYILKRSERKAFEMEKIGRKSQYITCDEIKLVNKI